MSGRLAREALLWLRLAAAVGFVLLLAACAPAAPGAAIAQPAAPTVAPTVGAAPQAASEAPSAGPTTVQVGVTRTLSEAGQWIALERGYFQEQGIAVEFAQFDSAARMIAPLGSGQLAVGSGAISAGLFNAIARGVPIKIVGPQARHDPGASAVQLVVRKDLIESGQFADYRDLRGRQIAVPAKATASHYAAVLALQRGGLSAADAEITEMSFTDMIAAFGNQAIDVANQAEPTSTLAEDRGVAVKWREVADVRPGIQFTVVLYSPEFADHQADLARRWMVAYLKGVRDYNDAFKKNHGRAEVVSILTRQLPVRDPDLYDRMGFAYVDPDGRVDEASIVDQLQWYMQQGMVPEPVDLTQIVDLSFADLAVQHLGRYE
jgi:NitT/TauT family transport system substrate-binding protein